MGNFNPDQYENTVNPYRLSVKEQKRIMENVNDERLTNPPGDYFKLKTRNSVVDVPKLPRVSIKTTDGKIRSITVTNYIKQHLETEDYSN